MKKKPGKKILFSIAGISACVVFVCATMSTAAAENPIRLIVNGKTIQTDVPPQMMEGRVMVPIRWVAEALGAEVKWDEENRAVMIDTKTQSGQYENPYRYPRLPQEITSPEMLLQAYFASLAYANNLSLEQSTAAGGTLGMGQQPYQTAYHYWSAAWRAEHSFEEFLDSWSGTAHVELLKLYEAEMQDGHARFFAETKHLEFAGNKRQLGEYYYAGFFTVTLTEDGWRIAEGSLEPQNLAWKLGGHQPWLADPAAVAIVQGLGRPLDEGSALQSRLEWHADDHVTVVFADNTENRETAVEAVRLTEGTWRVIAVEKSIPFSEYAGPGGGEVAIRYSDKQKESVRAAGRKYGIEPLLPAKGMADDYLMEIRFTKHSLELVYPHFSVEQSNRNLAEPAPGETAETILFPGGQKLLWFPEQRTLTFQTGGVHVALGSAKSVGKEEFVKIARSMMEEL